MISTAPLVPVKHAPAGELFQIARHEVIQCCPRFFHLIPPSISNVCPPQCVMPISSYHIGSHPYFFHPNHRVTMVVSQPLNICCPQLSPPSATSATYGKRISLSPLEAASMGRQRPFKVLTSPKAKPLPLIAVLDPNTEAAYKDFKNQMMAGVSEQNSRNNNMIRNVSANPEKLNDPEYLEKRKKNNEAAKKSRDARKSKEDEMAIRVAFLENKIYKLMTQLVILIKEKRNRIINRKRPRLSNTIPLEA